MFAGRARAICCGSLFALLIAAAPTKAADDSGIERLATCADSWVDWQKSSDPQMASLAAHFRSGFTHKQGDAFIVPKTVVSLAGFRVLQVFPESVGMGVGFSVLVSATFDRAKAVFEKKVGKPLQHCETGDGMRSCEHQIADKRTFMLMSSDAPADEKTLVGCYYFYEK